MAKIITQQNVNEIEDTNYNVLIGDFETITLNKKYQDLTIIAYSANIKGLVLSGSNITIIGGNITAPQGKPVVGPPGYGIWVRGSNIAIKNVNLGPSNRAIVTDGANNIKIENCDFNDVRQDGIISSGGSNLEIINNRFRNFTPVAGDHSDAIQIRNGINGLKIIGNTIESISQGIGQMDAPTDAPLNDVLVANNVVSVTGFHSITFGNVTGYLDVINNDVRQVTGRRTVLRLPSNTRINQNNRVLK